jgi:hypothetical protein
MLLRANILWVHKMTTYMLKRHYPLPGIREHHSGYWCRAARRKNIFLSKYRINLITEMTVIMDENSTKIWISSDL